MQSPKIPRQQAVPASYIVLIQDGKTLLSRRVNTGYEDGNYGLVSGHVDAGENFTDAVIREANEEVGLILPRAELTVAHLMHRDSGSQEKNERIDVFFTTSSWQGVIENLEPDKCDELAWFDLDKLPENIIPYIRQALDCIRKQIFYSEFGWKNKK